MSRLNNVSRILVVDDSVVVRGLMSRLIDAEADLEVASTAPNGAIALHKVEQYDPDLVILDLEMPVMSGLEALDEIRKTNPVLPVVVLSAHTDEPGCSPKDVLIRGASACVAKPTDTVDLNHAKQHVQEELISTIRDVLGRPSIAHGGGPQAGPPPPQPRARPPTSLQDAESAQPIGVDSSPSDLATATIPCRPSTQECIDAVVLASSTGGPAALEQVLVSLVEPLPVPMFIVQHMPAKFTRELAERINARCTSVVVEAAEGVTVALGCDVVVQDEATSVVWGMPGAIAEAGIATHILPLAAIGPQLALLVDERARH